MVAVAAVAAYGFGVAGIAWFAADSLRIPSIVWFWSGYSRLGWWAAMLVGFAAFGVPAFIGAIVWRRSEARRVLLLEIDELKRGGASRRSRLERSTRSIA